MGAHGDLWGPMGPLGTYGDLWGPMRTLGELWGPMGSFGDLWGRMGTYAFFRILVVQFFPAFPSWLDLSETLDFFFSRVGGINFLHTHFDTNAPPPPFLQASYLYQTYHTSCCIHCKHNMPHQTSDIRLYTQFWSASILDYPQTLSSLS